MKNSDYADIKIFYRIFPLDKPCWDYVRIKDKNTIYVRRLQELNDSSKKDVEPHFWEFFTDGVFHNTTQKHIYSSIAEGLLEDLTKGYSATIAAYGQSGTGKSLTLAGLQLSSEDLGIAPRTAQDLFEYEKKLPSHMKMAIQISYVEFNENGAVDLLLKFPNEMDHWLVREKTTKLRVRSKLDALKTLFLAEARKRFTDTNAYFSHLFSSVLTFHVTTKNEQYSEPFMRESRLHIIDMAGVDTVGNLASIFKPVKEIGRANVTKCDLTQLFLYLAKQKHNQTNIKERSNPLVYYLGNDLSARSMLRFIGHIKTLREDLPMTISMMRFGSLLKGIPPEKKIVEKKDDIKAQAKQLRQKLEQLQKEEMLNSILMNQDLSALNEDRTEHLQAIVQQYLANTLTEISVMNVAEVSMVFRIFKDVYNRTKAERLSCLMERKELTNANASSGSLPSNKHKRGSRGSRGSVPSKGSVNKTRKSANKTKIIKGAIPEGKPFHEAHDQQNGVKMENAISNMSVTDKNMSPKPSSTHKDSRLSKSGQGSFSYMPKRKSRSLVNGKQSSVATLESISMPPVPEAVLENEEAWTEYKRQSTYKMLQAEYQANEVNIREAYNSYMEGMQKLQAMKSTAEKKRQELLESTMVRNFNSSTRVDPGTAELLNTTEAICKENLDNAEKELVEYQEMVLTTQTQLKLYLNNRKDLKAQINEGFEAFSKSTYHIPLIAPDEMQGQDQDISTKRTSRRISKSSTIKDAKTTENIESKLMQFKKMLEVEKNRNSNAVKKSKTTWK